MENLKSSHQEKQSCDSEFLTQQLNLVVDDSSGMLKVSDPLDVENIPRISPDSIESFTLYFEGVERIIPDKICRPKGDTTFFTTAGVQHFETILKEKGEFGRESFVVCQPVIRSQFIDKVCDGTSTSFVNFSVEIIEATPSEFIKLCNELIRIISDQGVSISDLRFTIENNVAIQGNKKFSNISITVYTQNIEIGECVYIYDYPVTEDRKVAIADLGFGIERLNWGIKANEHYFPEFAEIYNQYEEIDSNKITALIDSIRSMVLIAGDSIVPSGHDHGYRLRQFSKRFVERNQEIGIGIEKIINICFNYWCKWGNQSDLSVENIIEIIKMENDRNFNNMFLSKLRQSNNIELYIEINQSTDKFLQQIQFSLSDDIIKSILDQLK